MCCVTSTSATARSRVACRMLKPSVATSTTSPVVAAPRCHSTIAQASSADRQHHGDRPRAAAAAFPDRCRLRRRASISRSTVASKRRCSRRSPPNARTSGMLPIDVDHFAVDGGRLVGKVMMQRAPGGGEPEHDEHENAGDDDQAGRHRRAHGRHPGNRHECRDARRQHVPHEHVLDRERRVGGRGDPARQGAGQPLGEIARRVAGEMAEQVAAQVAGHADEGVAGNPAGDPPQQIVGDDQRQQQGEREPRICGCSIRRQRIDQKLDAVLRAHRADDRRQHRHQDDGMTDRGVRARSGQETRAVAERSGRSDPSVSLEWLATRRSMHSVCAKPAVTKSFAFFHAITCDAPAAHCQTRKPIGGFKEEVVKKCATQCHAGVTEHPSPIPVESRAAIPVFM